VRLNGAGPTISKCLLFAVISVSMAVCQTGVRAQNSRPVGVHQKVLSHSTRRVVFDKGAFSGPSTLLPVWSNGYLVTLEAESFQAGLPNVRLYDESGTKVREAAIWFEGSQRVVMYSAVATPDGRILGKWGCEQSRWYSGTFYCAD